MRVRAADARRSPNGFNLRAGPRVRFAMDRSVSPEVVHLARLTLSEMDRWLLPPSHPWDRRHLTKKDQETIQYLVRVLGETGALPATITLGRLGPKLYLIDGKHRREAMRVSGIQSAKATVQYIQIK